MDITVSFPNQALGLSFLYKAPDFRITKVTACASGLKEGQYLLRAGNKPASDFKGQEDLVKFLGLSERPLSLTFGNESLFKKKPWLAPLPTDQIAGLLRLFYQIYHPHRIASVESVMFKYQGREQVLNLTAVMSFNF